MDDSGLLREDIKNKLKYELHLSSYPDDQLIEGYKNHVVNLIKDCVNAESKDILRLKKHNSQNLLYGYTKFDENIEEEWFIIYLLYQLSIYDHDLVIKVYDNDGDILLIEAAEHLPQWLESRKSKNRSFIHKGNLHIIPENINLKTLSSPAQYIRDNSSRTLAKPSIQNAIKEQMSGMPDKKAWLSKKLQQLDEIVFSKDVDDKTVNLSLASVMAMEDDYLNTSPMSSPPSSTASPSRT